MSSNQEIGNMSRSDATGININGSNNNINKKLFIMPSEYHMRAAYIVTVISIASLIIAIGMIVWMCHKGDCIGFESISFGDASVTSIGAITAILLGWNIYSVIDVKSVKRDYEKFKNDLEQENKRLLEEYKKELNEENKSLKETINSMQEKIKELDIFGCNKGKCSVFTINSKISEEEINCIINRITSYYNEIGINAELFMKSRNNGKLSLTFKNGGISQLYSNRIKEQLKDEFGLYELTINIKDSLFSGSGILIKRGDKFYTE